jgi:hypothetical protein
MGSKNPLPFLNGPKNKDMAVIAMHELDVYYLCAG